MPCPGPPTGQSHSPTAQFFSGRPCPGGASLPLPRPEGAPTVLPRARLRSTKAARPPKCECRSLRAGGGPAGVALRVRVRVPALPRPRPAPPSHQGCIKEPEGSSVCAQQAPDRLGFPGALPQRRVVWMWFGARYDANCTSHQLAHLNITTSLRDRICFPIFQMRKWRKTICIKPKEPGSRVQAPAIIPHHPTMEYI